MGKRARRRWHHGARLHHPPLPLFEPSREDARAHGVSERPQGRPGGGDGTGALAVSAAAVSAAARPPRFSRSSSSGFQALDQRPQEELQHPTLEGPDAHVPGDHWKRAPYRLAERRRGREVLLGRKKGWAPGRYSALAGFVEPGEMLEDTVRRETREEVGVEVENIRYFGSQPWPFPHSLMVAFTADYAGGKITPDGVEIDEARFFDAEQLPQLPPSISISRRLITTVCARLARGEEV